MTAPIMRTLPEARSRAAFAMVVLCSGIFFAALDQAVVYGALPAIMLDLNLPVTELDRVAWVVISYLLGYTAVMPLTGRASDVYGHGRVFVACLLLFVVGSVLTAVASSLHWMVGARVVQAIGGGAMVPVTMAIAGGLYAREGRSVALGVIGATVEAGGVLGPLYGAVVAQHFGWRWVFWINVPVGLLVLLLSYSLLTRDYPRVRGHVDYPGGVLLAIGLTSVSLALYLGLGRAHQSLDFVWLASVAAISFALFLYRQSKAAEPLFRLSLFRGGVFSAANVAHLLVGGALVIALVSIPLMTDTIMGQSPLEGGLRLMRFTLAIPFGAVAGGFICRRSGYRLPMVLGLSMSALGFWLMSRWTLDVADPAITVHLATTGLGFGLVVAPVGTAVLDSVQDTDRGVASALVTLMRLAGMIIGLSALSSWGMGYFAQLTSSISLNDLIASPELINRPVLSLFQRFFLIGSSICLAALIPSLWMRKRKGS
ncbi:MAG: MFS transporter [Chloroflexi bacterium]|nr:MFS transporter [Chloroflexota bacterium]